MYLSGLHALGWVGSVDVRSIYPKIFLVLTTFCHELHICQAWNTDICYYVKPMPTEAILSNLWNSISKNIMHSTDFCDFLWICLPPRIISRAVCSLSGNIFGVEISCGRHADDGRTMCR